jgi:hypothetical protein
VQSCPGHRTIHLDHGFLRDLCAISSPDYLRSYESPTMYMTSRLDHLSLHFLNQMSHFFSKLVSQPG